MNRPELLVPAGNLEKLETAIHFGADAIYIGGKQFGLRAHAGNFDLEELRAARELTRERQKDLYLTLNAYLRPSETEGLEGYLEELRPLEMDAYIVSDPGVLAAVRRVDPHRVIHLSTQANTTSPGAVRFWQEAGVRRVNLARELNLEEIRHIRSESDAELEVFVHGAMCVAYSGRCLLSAALTGRSANRGSCAHPCRWKYHLMEETRPGEFFPVAEDQKGAYLLNSRDLCLVGFLPDLVKAGVNSLKIEGRMKSRYYIAAVTRVYRTALDHYLEDPAHYRFDPFWQEELEKVSHRPYDQGFLFSGDDSRIHDADSHYRRSHDYVGDVLKTEPDGGTVRVRNRFFPGEMLEAIGPGMRQSFFRVEGLRSEEGERPPAAQPNAVVRMSLPSGVGDGDLLRRKRN